jgi:hypothetical protein
MIKRILLITSICVHLFHCKSKENDLIAPVDEKVMIDLMTDVYYLDSHFSELNSYIKDSIVYLKYNDLLKKYGVTQEQFKQAQNYYSQNDKAHQRLDEGIRKKLQEAMVK